MSGRPKGSQYSQHGTGNSRLAETQRKADEIQDVMRSNLELALDRGERLENMEDKASALENQASMFSKNATKVKRHFCLQYVKVTILIVVILLIIGLIIGITVWQKSK